MISVLDSASGRPGSSPGWGHWRAANNTWSSDIGWPKFAHVWQNSKCGWPWCPDNFLIVNHFTATMNEIQPFVFGDVRPQFCFVPPRWCLRRTYMYVLSSEKSYLQPCIVLCFWARDFTLTVPLSTQVYKLTSTSEIMLGLTLQWTIASIPSSEGGGGWCRNTPRQQKPG